MPSLSNLYPGHMFAELFVVVAVAVTLLSATAWVASLFLPRHPAIRHWVLLSALVASLATPMFATAFVASGSSFIAVPWFAAVESPSASPGSNEDGRPNHLPTAPETVVPAGAPDPAVARPSTKDVEVAQVMSTAKRQVTSATNPFRSTVVLVVIVWSCGMVVSIAGLAQGGLHLCRLRQSLQPIFSAELGTVLDDVKRLLGARTSPTVMVSQLARSPMAAGLFRPVIVLPTGLTSAIGREQLRDVLLHEFAHIERLDCVVVLLQALAKAAFWPILFVHLLNRQLARAREDICDNYVLTYRDGVNYGETLLQLAQLARRVEIPAGTVGILHWRGKLEQRIFGLLHQRRSKMVRPPTFISVSVLVLFLSASALLCGTTIREARGREQKTAPARGSEPQTATEARGVVSGELVKADGGAPVPGATLLLRDLGNGRLRRATTDDTGRFHFDDIPQGQFHIWAFKEPLASAREMIIGQETNTEVKPRFAPLRLTMSRGKQIKVTVTSAVSGQAIEGAKVELAYPDRRSKVTAKDGTADIQGLLPDRYSMTIQAAGYARVLREFDLKNADNVTLQSVSLARGGTIVGTVTDEDQKPLAKASIVFRTHESPVGFYGESPYSDQEGEYRSLYLPLNTPIRIFASLKDYVGQEQEVTLTDRQNALRVNFQLKKRPRGATVHGVVTDVLGVPIAGASVGSFGSGPGEESGTTTDPSGRFSLEDVKKNQFGHELIVRAPGFMAARQSFEPAAGMESVAISIKLESGHSIRVRVENSAGEPIPGAFVNVNDAGAPYSLGEFLRTDRDGQFESNSLPPNSTFVFYAPGYSSSEKERLTLDGKDSVVVTLQPTAVIRGKVVDAATGEAIKQFRVRIGFSADIRPGDVRGTYDGELGDPGLTFQSEEGAFTLDELTNGMPFKVIVDAEGYDQGVAPRVVAQAKDSATAVRVVLRKREPLKLATLVGKVIDHKGGPISGVQLRLIVSSEQPDGDNANRFNWALIDSGQLAQKDYVDQYLSAVTDEEGRFALKELLPDRFLQLAYWGKKAPKGRMTIAKTEAGDSHSLTLQLPEPAAIKGTIDVETFADAGRMALMIQGQSFHHYDYPLVDGKSDFEFVDLPPGTYLLSIMGKPERIEGSPGAYSTKPRASRMLTLKPGEEVNVQFTKDHQVQDDKR